MKEYLSPELEIIKLRLTEDVLIGSQIVTESPVSQIIVSEEPFPTEEEWE